MKEALITRSQPTFGCDPELFFANSEGKIVGAEKVLPKEGYLATQYAPKGVILDGVQVELNPAASACRQTVAIGIIAAFKTLRNHLMDKSTTTCFDAVITVSKKELESLSEQSRKFGCAPSNNFYDKDATIKANPAKYLKRSAGGHIHLGLSGAVKMHRERLVPILDAIVGNTCVMIDRCPDAAERRKNYGRAGEYRLPSHGIEYRTLSNFWLRSYPLFSLVLGLARLSVSILDETLNKHATNWWDAESGLMQHLDLKKVQRAINENDLQLAKENWQVVRDYISQHVPKNRNWRQETGLDEANLDAFDYFLEVVEKKGLNYWFPDDPLKHWCNTKCDGNDGWERWLDTVVRKKMPSTVVKIGG